MAWLQNLAGHAENLLNKIDQNAATVLSDTNKQVIDVEKNDLEYSPEFPTVVEYPAGLKKLSRSSTPDTVPVPVPVDANIEKHSEPVLSMTESQKSDNIVEDLITEKSIKSNGSTSSNSLQNSFSGYQEIENLQSKIAKLELENHDVNKQLLNIQHLYSEMRNENANLQFHIERLNEQLTLAQNEKEQYVARAQRILQEKEKLLTSKHASDSKEDIDNISTACTEKLRQELELHQAKVVELTQINTRLSNDLQSLQLQHQVIHQGLSQSNQSLEQSLLNEKKHRAIAEEECIQKSKELQLKHDNILHLQNLLSDCNEKSAKLKQSLHKKLENTANEEYENRIRSLTQTLMLNQNKLETITTERNALRLQLEKLEAEYKTKIADLTRDKIKVIDLQEVTDEAIVVPTFMRVSPHDAGVTRRVKHAYSTLDAISIRTGIFLRRYPVARVFVFSYMVILHIWVLTVLLWYVPSA